MALDHDGVQYLSRAARASGLLDAETEYALAVAWRDRKDKHALDRLIRAYLRLAISTAAKYRRYGLSMNDLIQEASLGLMKAAEKFDPDRGVRFSTYAVWWIKASVQDFVLRNWSLVRTGSTASQKSLFFNFSRVKAQLEREDPDLRSTDLQKKVAETLGVPLHDVVMMEGRLVGSDMSLNAVQSGEDEGREWIDLLPDDAPNSAELVEDTRDRAQLKYWLSDALHRLNSREQYILSERQLRDDPRTLESLGAELGLSKERIRQLEAAAFAKMRRALAGHETEVRAFFS